jgi:hypothetical protein
MSRVYEQLVKRIRGEVADLDGAVDKVRRAWSAAQLASADQDLYLDSAALSLHSFYSGLEGSFELIAKSIDRVALDGETWHRDLLRRMAMELPDTRPAVISTDNALKLLEYLRFRHLVRNIYATSLSATKMAGLVDGLATLWQSVRQELLAFADLLEQSNSARPSTHD